jgi:hypothetical protein
MKVTKTLMLAALTARSLGIGAAFAQQTPTGEDAFWTARAAAAQTTAIIGQARSALLQANRTRLKPATPRPRS